VLTTLVLGDLVTTGYISNHFLCRYIYTYIPDSEVKKTGRWEGQVSHVIRELLEVVLLLLDLLPELEELLLLGLADEQLLVGALTLLEGVSVLVGIIV